ncbi:MAG: tetratricopeptide repeat protein [Verrucomicrobiota bacterium]
MRRLAVAATAAHLLLFVALEDRPACAAQPDADRSGGASETTVVQKASALEKPFVPDLDRANDAYEMGDYATAFKHYSALAARGNAVAQTNVGMMYRKGRGVPRDYEKAVQWLNRAAAQGDAVAEYQLGKMHGSGYGVPQDYAAAFRWFHRSAEKGYSRAQYRVGMMYKLGRGVPKNNVFAYMWLSLVVSRPYDWGSRKASLARDAVAADMTPDEVAEARRLAREWKPKQER